MAPIEAWLVLFSVCLGVSLSLSQSLSVSQLLKLVNGSVYYHTVAAHVAHDNSSSSHKDAGMLFMTIPIVATYIPRPLHNWPVHNYYPLLKTKFVVSDNECPHK